jgi:hypothetical protein
MDDYKGNYTAFDDQPLELRCGGYECTVGIVSNADSKKVFRFPHPIMISKFIKNITRKTVKVELAFSRYGKWDYITVEKEIISKSKAITSLANFNIMVTEDNAKELVNFLHYLEIINERIIPVKLSASSLGYVGSAGFVPYCENVEFDGKLEFRRIFDSVNQAGDFTLWKSEMTELMRHSKKLNAIISAAFASVILAPVGGQPFFVHIHGTESGTGKTAALHIAAGIWGDPDRYKITFNATNVGLEMWAGVVNELPLCVDELQLQNDSRNQKHFNPYLLASGEGKSRSDKGLGLRETFYWNNVIITTGESRLSSQSGGAGELNRIVEFEINDKHDLFENPQKAGTYFDFTKRNHGYAGRSFVEWFYGDEKKNNIKLAAELVSIFESELVKRGISSKQARAGAFILTANRLINPLFLSNEQSLLLSTEWISEFLKSEETVDVTLRAYERICDWVTQNNIKFVRRYEFTDEQGKTSIRKISPPAECYGEYDEPSNIVYIIKLTFDTICEMFRFDSRSILSGLKRKQLIDIGADGKSTVVKRIDGYLARAVCLKLPELPEENTP